jgi:hypothetical protein
VPQHAVSLPFTISSQRLIPSGTTWQQYKTGGLKVVLDNLVNANLPLANPSVAATVGSSSAASSLPVQNGYQVSYSWVDTLGETLAGGISAPFNQVDNAHLNTVTIPALPPTAQCANLYLLNPANGITSVYATGVTSTTFALSYPLVPDVPGPILPPANTTGATGDSNLQVLYSIILGPKTEVILEQLVENLSSYLSGYPIEWRECARQHNRWTGIFAYWYQCLSEIETLFFANVPTAGCVTTPVGMPQFKWALP